MVSAIGGIANSITNGLSGFFNSLINIGNDIINFTTGFFETLGDTVAGWFIPGEDYFDNKYQEINTKLESKFAYVKVFKDSITTTISDPLNYRIPFLAGTYIDFGWYSGYRAYIKGFISAFLWVLTIANIIRDLKVKFTITG